MRVSRSTVALLLGAVVMLWLGATLGVVNHHEAHSANAHPSASVHNAVSAQHYRNQRNDATIPVAKSDLPALFSVESEIHEPVHQQLPNDGSLPLLPQQLQLPAAATPHLALLPPPAPPPPPPPPPPPARQQRIIAIGDIHGDLAALKRALLVAEVVDEAGAWVGGSTAVVQIGDLLNNAEESDRAVPTPLLLSQPNRMRLLC